MHARRYFWIHFSEIHTFFIIDRKTYGKIYTKMENVNLYILTCKTVFGNTFWKLRSTFLGRWMGKTEWKYAEPSLKNRDICLYVCVCFRNAVFQFPGVLWGQLKLPFPKMLWILNTDLFLSFQIDVHLKS